MANRFFILSLLVLVLTSLGVAKAGGDVCTAICIHCQIPTTATPSCCDDMGTPEGSSFTHAEPDSEQPASRCSSGLYCPGFYEQTDLAASLSQYNPNIDVVFQHVTTIADGNHLIARDIPLYDVLTQQIVRPLYTLNCSFLI